MSSPTNPPSPKSPTNDLYAQYSANASSALEEVTKDFDSKAADNEKAADSMKDTLTTYAESTQALSDALDSLSSALGSSKSK